MIKKIFATFALIAYLWIGLVGMHMTSDFIKNTMEGVSTSCIFMGSTQNICPMDALEHLRLWQNMMQTQQSLSTSLVFLAIIAVAVFWKLIWNWQSMFEKIKIRIQYRFKKNRDLNRVQYLLMDLARGRLHPKIYS